MNGNSVLAPVTRRIRRALESRRSVAELRAAPTGELRQIAQDMGLSEAALLALGGQPDHAELMPQRLEQLGLDPSYVKVAETAAYRDMERVCASCKAWRQCARDMAHGDVETGMHSYCLNAPTIDALMVERPK
jgi:hypothetical protein